MSISAVTYVLHPTIDGLISAVTTAIAAGKQPFGEISFHNGLYYQTMTTGTAANTVVEAQADITALKAINAQTVAAADGAIPITVSGSTVLTKATAAAMTIAATATDGIRRRIYNGSSAAHVITGTGLLQDGLTEAGNTITFAAKKGAFVEVESYGSKWLVLSGNHYTVA